MTENRRNEDVEEHYSTERKRPGFPRKPKPRAANPEPLIPALRHRPVGPYTVVRFTWMLPDGTEIMAPSVQVNADMRQLAEAKFRYEMWPDKPPAVMIAPEGVEFGPE